MVRIEIATKEPVVVPRLSFDSDWRHGFCALEFNPERTETLTDSRTKREIKRVVLADIAYRCMRCQFDTLDRRIIEEHLATGLHLWSYGPFKTPYGHIGDAVIEGVDGEYTEFIKEM